MWGGNEALRREGEDKHGQAEEMHKSRDEGKTHGQDQAKKMRKLRQEQAEEMRKLRQEETKEMHNLRKENEILRKENENKHSQTKEMDAMRRKDNTTIEIWPMECAS